MKKITNIKLTIEIQYGSAILSFYIHKNIIPLPTYV